MSDVLVVQNTSIEGSGVLGELLVNDGFSINTVFPKKEKLPQKDFSILVILGGPQSANDEKSYLRNEEQLIQDYVTKDHPVLGICLGSQLIAKSFGAKIFSGQKKEIGFYHDLVIDNTQSKLFSGFQNPFTVFHWHGDTFELPKKAVRLVHSSEYANQAFQIGTAIGIQFHLEVNANMVNLWLDKNEEKLKNISYIKHDIIRQEIDVNISTVMKNMETFYNNFKSAFKL